MKKMIISALAVTLLIVISAGFRRVGEKMSADALNSAVKDLPEDGLVLVGYKHPAFDKEFSRALKPGKAVAQDVVEGVKPFTVFLQNNSKHDIIAYCLLWEIKGEDGSVTNQQYDSYAEPGLLMGKGGAANAAAALAGNAIRANKSRAITWSHVGDEFVGGDGMSAGDADQDLIRNGADDLQTRVSDLEAVLTHAAAINVTLDCAVFDDGTLVGPDTANFFPKLKAQIDAKRDLLLMIQHAYAAHQTPEVILDSVKSIADDTDGARLSDSTPTSFYNFYRRLFAREVLSVRASAARNNKEGVLLAIQPLGRAWVALKRKRPSQ